MCKHRNKNEGCGAQPIFFKGKHAHSFSSNKHKMGAMTGTCHRIQRNSFSEDLLVKELREKTREWIECLQYTPRFVLTAVKYLANKHGGNVWERAHKNLLVESAWWLLHKPGVIDLRKEFTNTFKQCGLWERCTGSARELCTWSKTTWNLLMNKQGGGGNNISPPPQ